ncbi:MAG TPA: alpha-amylase, partial [Bacteroidales bacterium]|nr:alpha-amylase [Bacteroidales bacterium]
MKSKQIIFCSLIFLTLISCTHKPVKVKSIYQPKPYVELTHPEWSKNATIYEVNIRQYTPE